VGLEEEGKRCLVRGGCAAEGSTPWHTSCGLLAAVPGSCTLVSGVDMGAST
jgi:hypothetical protein